MPRVLHVRKGALSHAYVANLHSPWLAGVTPYNGCPIDVLIAECDMLERHGFVSPRTFAIRPMGAIQRPGAGSNIMHREAWHRAAWMCMTCRLYKCQGSLWSNVLLRYRVWRSMCEHVCTCVNVRLFLALAPATVLLLLLVACTCVAVVVPHASRT